MLDAARAAVVSCPAASLGTTEAAWASFTGAATSDCAVVRIVTTAKCGATSIVAGGNNLQYDTTKAAVAGLTRGLAMDHAVDGIRVNAVCPGPILTPFHERRIAAAGKTLDEYRAESSARTMLKRPGTPQEVAACVLFLASEEASYVTGTCLFVDGGFTAL